MPAKIRVKRPASSPVRSVWSADHHLDLGAWGRFPDLYGDSMYAFSQMTWLAIELGVKDVFLAGDILDAEHPDSEVVQELRAELDQLAREAIAVNFIQGQHELADPPWLAAIHDWPRHYDHTRGVQRPCVYGLDWTPADRLAEALADIPEEAEILLCHQVWEEHMGNIRACEGSFAQIPHVTTVFTGDYHHRQEGEYLGASGQKLRVISPGATHMRAIDEPAKHYVYLLREDGSWEPRQLLSRPTARYRLPDDVTLDAFVTQWTTRYLPKLQAPEVIARLPLHIRKPIIRVSYLEGIPDAYGRIREAIGDSAFLLLATWADEDQQPQSPADKLRREKAAGGLLGCLELVVPPEDEDYAALTRLLDAADQKLEIQRMKEEHFAIDSVGTG